MKRLYTGFLLLSGGTWSWGLSHMLRNDESSEINVLESQFYFSILFFNFFRRKENSDGCQMKCLINSLFVSYSIAQAGLELVILLPQPPTPRCHHVH